MPLYYFVVEKSLPVNPDKNRPPFSLPILFSLSSFFSFTHFFSDIGSESYTELYTYYSHIVWRITSILVFKFIFQPQFKNMLACSSKSLVFNCIQSFSQQKKLWCNFTYTTINKFTVILGFTFVLTRLIKNCHASSLYSFFNSLPREKTLVQTPETKKNLPRFSIYLVFFLQQPTHNCIKGCNKE